MEDIEDIGIKRLKDKINQKYTEAQYLRIEKMVLDFLSSDYNYKTLHDLSTKFMNDMAKKYKLAPRKEEILYVYRRMVIHNKLSLDNNLDLGKTKLLERCFKKKDMRETSGVMVFAVLSSPYPETGSFGYITKYDEVVIVDKNSQNLKNPEKDNSFNIFDK